MRCQYNAESGPAVSTPSALRWPTCQQDGGCSEPCLLFSPYNSAFQCCEGIIRLHNLFNLLISFLSDRRHFYLNQEQWSTVEEMPNHVCWNISKLIQPRSNNNQNEFIMDLKCIQCFIDVTATKRVACGTACICFYVTHAVFTKQFSLWTNWCNI